jgi:hypothetical protein
MTEGEKVEESFFLQFRWTESRAQDTYGWNVCTLYVNGEKAARCNGGGYDMEGTVLGLWIANRFAGELCEQITTPMYGLSFHDPNYDPGKAVVPGTGKTVEAREASGESLGLERYQAIFSGSSPVPTPTHHVPYLDGGCGKECMIKVLKALGGQYQDIESGRSHTVAAVSVPVKVQEVGQSPTQMMDTHEPTANSLSGMRVMREKILVPKTEHAVTTDYERTETMSETKSATSAQSTKTPEAMSETKRTRNAQTIKTPEAKIELGNVRALIFLNDTEKNGKFYSVSFERVYADKSNEGAEKVSYNFREADLDRLVKVAQAAKQEIARLTPAMEKEQEPELRITR